MITNVESAVMMASIADVVSNVASTAGVIDGAAPVIMAPAPAGTDEASALATMNTSAHSADLLGTSALGFLELARYAGALGVADASYEIVDAANGSQFL
ncbi:PE domain-containing protein [Mycobacterium simiae]|uniref:PE domain-containing protein n=1 Tax=Mycobacterium simiae TaxID=1784 RepID=A0A5B1BP40_MYCSI|nr:PE domain-containing protein [Mycobacterium simiae]KAA1249871.1 PE domain-containing protein [Mycobacterium simiae]